MFKFDYSMLVSAASTAAASASTASSASASTVSASVETLLRMLKSKVVLRVDSSILEKVVMREMVKKLLGPLSVNVKLEKRVHGGWVRANYGVDGKVQAECLGMGCESATWYGSVDARLGGQVSSEDVDRVTESDRSEDSEIVLMRMMTVKRRMGGHLL